MRHAKGKLCAVGLTTALLFCSFNNFSVFATSQSNESNISQNLLPNQTFDESNVKTRFGVISDVHIAKATGNAPEKFASALQQLKSKANGNLDAVLVAGDLTDYGKPEQAEIVAKIVNENLDLSKTEFVIGLGNHEYYDYELDDAPLRGGNLYKEAFGDAIYKGASADEITRGNYHTTINGFDYIVVNCVQYLGGVQYEKADIEWLKTQLQNANSSHPGKPIYVVSHPMVTGTSWGSDYGIYWAGTDLYDIFKQYPQVIYFSGHVHFPLNDERIIWQGDFTTVGTGSVRFGSLKSENDSIKYCDLDGSEPLDCTKFSQGLYVEVDNQNNTKITRMDFYNKDVIKFDWIIPAPDADKNFLKCYTNDRAEGNTAPVFPKGAAITQVSKDFVNKTITFEFNQAVDNDMTLSYQISIIDSVTNQVIGKTLAYSDFYLHPKVSGMADKITKTANEKSIASFTVDYPDDYFIQVEAFDSYGLKSDPIKSIVYKGGIPETTTTTTPSSTTTTLTTQTSTTTTTTVTGMLTTESRQDTPSENTAAPSKDGEKSSSPKTDSHLPIAAAALVMISIPLSLWGGYNRKRR